MSPSLLRIEGILILITAAAIAVLNLKRTANLGLLWLTPVLLVTGLRSLRVLGDEHTGRKHLLHNQERDV